MDDDVQEKRADYWGGSARLPFYRFVASGCYLELEPQNTYLRFLDEFEGAITNTRRKKILIFKI